MCYVIERRNKFGWSYYRDFKKDDLDYAIEFLHALEFKHGKWQFRLIEVLNV